MRKTLEDFYNDLGARESSGNYKAVNQSGYIGKWVTINGNHVLIDK